MSQENIELFERANAAMNPGEFSDELAAELLAPGYRIENVATALSDKTYYGVDGVREWIADTFEGLDTGKTSRLSLGQMRSEKCELFQIRSGKVVRLVIYWDRKRALADLGLEE